MSTFKPTFEPKPEAEAKEQSMPAQNPFSSATRNPFARGQGPRYDETNRPWTTEERENYERTLEERRERRDAEIGRRKESPITYDDIVEKYGDACVFCDAGGRKIKLANGDTMTIHGKFDHVARLGDVGGWFRVPSVSYLNLPFERDLVPGETRLQYLEEVRPICWTCGFENSLQEQFKSKTVAEFVEGVGGQ